MSGNGKKPFKKLTASRSLGALLLPVFGFWLTLWFMGRQFVSNSGFGIWTGARTQDTSQWMADPYTLSHLLHGIFFYWLLLPTQRWLTVRSRFIIASLIEAGWEIVENTTFVIDRYRAATASLEYYGDSILNSTFDLLIAMLGFWLASKYNWKWMLLVVAAIELVLALLIRDNLTLNILMLLYPLNSIKEWQLGG
jgi:Protein of unknown function (DUF2585)